MDLNRKGERFPALTRRGFLMGTVALAVAGCGGGGSSNDYWGTYRGESRDGDIAAGVTVGRDDTVTYWSLYYDPSDELFADFGQTTLFDDDRFSRSSGGVRTYGQIFDDTIEGRSEESSNSNNGYDWEAYKAGRPNRDRPSRDLIGAFSGSARRDNIDIDILLHVDDDGNATFFGAFDDLDVNSPDGEAEFYAFESLSFDRNGDGYNYYFDFEGNRISIEDSTGDSIRLFYEFSDEFPELEGDVFDITLTRTSRSAAIESLKRPVRLSRKGTRPLGKFRRK